jgi:hypothetical protein
MARGGTRIVPLLNDREVRTYFACYLEEETDRKADPGTRLFYRFALFIPDASQIPGVILVEIEKNLEGEILRDVWLTLWTCTFLLAIEPKGTA